MTNTPDPSDAMIEAGKGALLTMLRAPAHNHEPLDYKATVEQIYLAMQSARISTPSEDVVERLARAMCLAEATDPDAPSRSGGLMWNNYEHMARAVASLTTKDRETDREALAYSVANAKLGEGPAVRCEGPTEFETRIAREWVDRVLAAQARASSASQRG